MKYLILFLFIPVLSLRAQHPPVLSFQGQASGWIITNSASPLDATLGLRYLPQAHMQFSRETKRKIDAEAALNAASDFGTRFFDSTSINAYINPYRLWARYSGNQFEMRIGLQKINFGSANLLRPLMWFDQVDPRDPLQITKGVWGILGRYYFLNNANLWLWALYGNKQAKAWEIGNTSQHIPEMGGRFQLPVKQGEIALSYHFRQADSLRVDNLLYRNKSLPEHRFAVDGRWDAMVGICTEVVYLRKPGWAGDFSNQLMATLGLDYTVDTGNGLYLAAENMVVILGKNFLTSGNTMTITGMTISYPISVNLQLTGIVYGDWKNSRLYSFANFQLKMNHFSFFLMAFSNPEQVQLPQMRSGNQIFAGNGLQLLLVYNH